MLCENRAILISFCFRNRCGWGIFFLYYYWRTKEENEVVDEWRGDLECLFKFWTVVQHQLRFFYGSVWYIKWSNYNLGIGIIVLQRVQEFLIVFDTDFVCMCMWILFLVYFNRGEELLDSTFKTVLFHSIMMYERQAGHIPIRYSYPSTKLDLLVLDK